MSQTPSEKFLYFTVGLLKGSPALEALRQDATKYHMIDHPGQLIALRLTEYYELINQGIVQPGLQVPVVKGSPTPETTGGHEQVVGPAAMGQSQSKLPVYTPDAPAIDASESSTNALNQLTGKMRTFRRENDQIVPISSAAEQNVDNAQFTGKMRALRRENDQIVSVSSTADQNADDAADYWSTLQ